MGQFDKAQQVYEILLEQKSDESGINIVKVNMKKQLNSMQNQFKSTKKIRSSNDFDLAKLYNNMGVSFLSMGEYEKAMSYYTKAFQIQEQFLPPNHPYLAMPYGNIALMCRLMRDYLNASSFLEKTIQIQERSLPSNYPDLAATYDNMSLLYKKMIMCGKKSKNSSL
jgi:tetratricopeptide (TPR) repeat protein